MVETNKIYHADCYDLIKQIPDKSIDCIYTDIPYLHMQGGSGSGALAKRIKTKSQGIIAISNGIDFKILDEFVRVMKKINCFIWCSKLQIFDILKYFVADLKCNFEVLTWCKTNPTPQINNSWLPDVEYCLYFRESGVPLNDGYHLKSKWYSSAININDKNMFNHPTIKPLDLVKRHLRHTTQADDVILDPFIGSGTTAIACKETNRQYIGIEINTEYHKIAVDRTNNINAKGQVSFVTM